MAEEHAALLKQGKQGVEAWNAWRRECTETCPDLGRADLRHMDLIGADLSGAKLPGRSPWSPPGLRKPDRGPAVRGGLAAGRTCVGRG